MIGLAARPEELRDVAEAVARGLASVHVNGAGYFIRTPVMFPGGSSVVVRIDGSRDTFFVSDYGVGYQEALMMNASLSYTHFAAAIAQRVGIEFDQRTFFVARATRDELPAVVMLVANCAQRAVIETSFNVEEKRIEIDRERFAARLVGAFGSKRVVLNAEVRGASTMSWPVLARVEANDQVVLFEHAKANKNSVVNIAAKFHDIARLRQPPRRVVSVKSKREMNEFLGLLSQAADVIEIDTPDDLLLRLAA
jgi:hypothetical protein